MFGIMPAGSSRVYVIMCETSEHKFKWMKSIGAQGGMKEVRACVCVRACVRVRVRVGVIYIALSISHTCTQHTA